MDPESLELLEAGLRKTMLSTSGAALDAALADLGWADMLADMPDLAIPLVFRLLGETGSHASVLNDVVLLTAGRDAGPTPALPYAGGGWVVWDYAGADPAHLALGGLPLRRVVRRQHARQLHLLGMVHHVLQREESGNVGFGFFNGGIQLLQLQPNRRRLPIHRDVVGSEPMHQLMRQNVREKCVKGKSILLR